MEKTEIPGLCKVGEGVLINTDNNALLAYKKRKEQAQKINTIEQDVIDMKTDLKEIKELLKGLVSK